MCVHQGIRGFQRSTPEAQWRRSPVLSFFWGVLKPVRQSVTLDYDAATHALVPRAPNAALIDDAIATYQTASWLFKQGRQHEIVPTDAPRHVAATQR